MFVVFDTLESVRELIIRRTHTRRDWSVATDRIPLPGELNESPAAYLIINVTKVKPTPAT